MEIKTKKIVALVFIIFVLVSTVGVFGYKFAKKTSVSNQQSVTIKQQDVKSIENYKADEMADWQTYVNEKEGFELKIPQDMKIDGYGGVVSIGYPVYQKTLPEGGRNMFISLEEDTIEKFIEKYEQKDPNINKIIKQEDIKIGDILAKKLIGTSAMGIDVSFILVEKNDKGHLVIEFSDVDSIHNKIISTFKFIESNNNEVLNWQTYRNIKYGFEINYPNNYKIFQSADIVNKNILPVSSDSKTVFITDKPDMFFCCEPTYLKVEVFDSPINDLEKWIKDGDFFDSDNEYRIKNRGYIDFAGEKAYKIDSECGIDSPGSLILVNHNSKSYYIRYDEKDCFVFSDKILSTFKFTN